MSAQLGSRIVSSPTSFIVKSATLPVIRWAWLGGLIAAFMLYVLGRWILTGHAVPTAPGPDPLPYVTKEFICWVQWVAMLAGAAAFMFFVIRPWQTPAAETFAADDLRLEESEL